MRTSPVTRNRDKRYFLSVSGFEIGTGGTPQTLPPSRVVVASDTVTYGADIIGWQSNIVRGVSATTSLVGYERVLRYQQEGFSSGYANPKGPYYPLIKNARWSISGNHLNFAGFPAIPPHLADPIAEQKASQAFLKSFLREQVAWRGGNTIAEFAETVRMLRNPIKSLFQHTETFVGKVGKLRKVYRRNPVDYRKSLGDAWLGYALGVAPLVSDVNDAHAAVRALSEDLNSVDTKRILGNGSNVVELERSENIGSPQFKGCLYDRVTTRINQVRYLGCLRCRPPGAGSIAENFGVGFADIVPAVWEAIPWSFIVDYFVNIGEVLDSYRLAWADWGWTNRTVRNRDVVQYSALRPNPAFSTDYVMYVEGGQAQAITKSVSRQSYGGVPYPNFQFSIPGTKVQFGNIAALVAAIARSKPVPFSKKGKWRSEYLSAYE